MARTCGTCTACCTALVVLEVEKPAGVRCRHVCPTGCTIYEARPTPCRTYQCLWLRGLLHELDRPDLTHVVVDAHDTPMGALVLLHEVKPGAADHLLRSGSVSGLTGRAYAIVRGSQAELRTPIEWPPRLVQQWLAALQGLDTEMRKAAGIAV